LVLWQCPDDATRATGVGSGIFAIAQNVYALRCLFAASDDRRQM